jgi:hypothetical protein
MYYDIYVLANERSQRTVDKFLTTWAEGFHEAADDYPVPQYTKSHTKMFAVVNQLIEYLLTHPEEYYAIYWSNPDRAADLASAMLFFTVDKGLIVGVSSTRPMQFRDNETEVYRHLKALLENLGRDFDAQAGCVLYEVPPPDSAKEFKQLAEECPIRL